jgi:hypothetical protein
MRPVGIFSERDFVNAVAQHGLKALSMPVESLMSAPFVSCGPSDRVEAAMAVMTRAKIRHLPVMEDGELLGIVSIDDGIVRLSSLKRRNARADILCRSRNPLRAYLLPPDVEGLGPNLAIGAGCQKVSAWMEVAMDECMSGKEILSLLR